MTTYTELFSPPENISRKFYRNTNPVGVTTGSVIVPPGAKCLIISSVGAGGWMTNNDRVGGGAAFARTKLTDIVAGETFNYQVGSAKNSLDAGSALGDSIVTRVTGNIVVNKAVRGTGVVTVPGGAVCYPGLAANCVGDIKRDGLVGTFVYPFGSQGGQSGGDLDDPHSYGFGGKGARIGRYPAAGPGGGGFHRAYYDAQSYKAFPPGGGLICFDFWTKDPGWIT